jgi:hypothetical protein
VNYLGACGYFYDLYLDECPYEFSASTTVPDLGWEMELSWNRDSKRKGKSEDEYKKTGAQYGV